MENSLLTQPSRKRRWDVSGNTNAYREPWNNSDATIIVEGETFHVHSQILGAASPVFDDILNSSIYKTCDITGKNKSAVLDVLDIIYSDGFGSCEHRDYWVDTNYRYELILGMSKDYQINSVQRFVDYALGEKPYSLSLFQLAEKFHLKLTSNKCCEYLSKSQVAKDFSGLSTSGISSDARLKILTAKLNACFNQQCSRCHNKATCTHLKPMEVKVPDQAIILALLNQ